MASVADTEALVRYVVTSLVDMPEAVSIERKESDELDRLRGHPRPV